MRQKMIAWIRQGWGAVSTLGLIPLALHWLPTAWRRVADLDTAKSILTAIGVDIPMIVSLVTNPLFGIAVVVVGLIGIPLAERGRTQIAWTIAGWGVFTAVLALLISVFAFGSMVNETGVLKLAEYYQEKHTERHLTTDSSIGLKNAVCKAKNDLSPVAFISVLDPESIQYAKEIMGVFRECKVTIEGDDRFPGPTSTGDTSRKGVFVVVINLEHPDDRSKALLNALRIASLKAEFCQWEGSRPPNYVQTATTVFVSYP